MAQGSKPIHANHRARMQHRVRENGLESLHEHEALEYLLYFAIPRQDTNPLAHRLIEQFGGFCRVLEASEEELLQVEGIGPASAQLIHSVLAFSRYYALHKRDTRKARPLDSFEAALEYVRPLFLGYQEERFYLVAMDDKSNPLRTILVATGLPNKVSFDPTALARQTIATRCTQVLLAHNHPSGMAVPSMEDLTATISIVTLLGPLGIQVADHLIITPTDAASMREMGRMPYYETAQRRVAYREPSAPIKPIKEDPHHG